MQIRSILSLFAVSLLWGCGPTGIGDDDDDSTPDDDECSYPDGAVEPMEVGGVITPYVWGDARTSAGDQERLDLQHVPCDTDEVIEWSPFDVLLFVSIPAW